MIPLRPTLRLLRMEENFVHGTMGMLLIDGQIFCATLEPPDIENARDISCIPAQQYICRKITSPTFGITYEVTDVPGRSHILFHAGNTDDDTAGCIILGKYHGLLGDSRAVVNSGNTFERFMRILVGNEYFHLTIKEVY